VRTAILLISLAACAVLSWSAGTLDALVVLSAVSLGAAGLLVRECSSGEFIKRADLRVGTVCFACLLCGAGGLLALAGTASLEECRETLAANYQPQRSDLLAGRASILGVAASVLVLAGAALPIGLFPFQFSQAAMFEQAPGWRAIATVSLLRLQGLALMVRVLDVASIGCEDSVQVMTGIAGAATCLAGAVLLCRHESLRQLAANLWLVSGGLAVVAYSVGVTQSESSPIQSVAGVPDGATLVLTVSLSGLIACVSLLALDAWLTRDGRRPEHFEELTGLARQSPTTSFLLTGTLLASLPVPTLPQFAVLLVIAGLAFVPGVGPDGRQQEFPTVVPLLIVGAAASALLLSGARLIQPLSQMFHHEPLRRFEPANGRSALLVSAVCVAALFLAGLQPGLLLAGIASLVSASGQ